MSVKKKFIISGGGTGGHIYPAVSIADQIKGRLPESEILFVGAKNRMEMQRVPKAGYRIIGLDIMGFDRTSMLNNLKLPFKILKSLYDAFKIIKNFKPDAVIGTGGYASAAVLFAASLKKIPTIVQEQNSFAGMTNKILARRANIVCTAYQGLGNVFPKEKIHLTGNPVRASILKNLKDSSQAKTELGFLSEKPLILILGGSLGAREINKAVFQIADKLLNDGFQIIWQCGKLYYDNYKKQLENKKYDKLKLVDFIEDMDLVYSAADLIISRSGAGTISELCLVGKPAILIPSPNVAENHQKFNALALVETDAAIMIEESDKMPEELKNKIEFLLENKDYCVNLSNNIKKLAKPESTKEIVDLILSIAK